MESEQLRSLLKIDEKRAEIAAIEQQMTGTDFWQNYQQANQLAGRLARLKSIVDDYELLQLGNLPENEKKEIERQLKIAATLSGQYDDHSAILSVHAGAGGTEAQDWTEMLWRMYQKFCQKQGWQWQTMEESKGAEAGLKSATARISGQFVFGYLKNEAGVHRLVRISPFDADKARHTSFALLEVIPEIAVNDKELEIESKDLAVDFYRASGHGGQNVNKVETAVRLTHLPTGTIVNCQTERTQGRNREIALQILKGKLAALLLKEQKEKIDELRGAHQKIEWGSQIRSYVLHPYQLIKDHRTGYEDANTQNVLNGNLEGFIEAELLHFATKDIK